MKRKKMDYFVALYDVARVINASLEPAEVLQEIVACVVRAMPVKACSLRLLDAHGKKLELSASCGLSDSYLQKGPILVQKSGIDRKALRGKTVFIENVQTDGDFQYKEKAATEGIRSVLVVPLMLEKKAVGVLRVYTEKKRLFLQREVEFLEAVASLSAIALDNARLHKTLQIRCDLMAAYKYRIDDN